MSCSLSVFCSEHQLILLLTSDVIRGAICTVKVRTNTFFKNICFCGMIERMHWHRKNVVRMSFSGVNDLGQSQRPHVRSWWYVSDRISVIEFAIPNCGGSNIDVRVVIAYGPTSQLVRENPTLADRFYQELISVITPPARFQLFVCGD